MKLVEKIPYTIWSKFLQKSNFCFPVGCNFCDILLICECSTINSTLGSFLLRFRMLVLFLILMFLLGEAGGQQNKSKDQEKFVEQVKEFGEIWEDFVNRSLGATNLQVIQIAYLLFNFI